MLQLDAFQLWYQFKGIWSTSDGEQGILIVMEFVGPVGFEIAFGCLN